MTTTHSRADALTDEQRIGLEKAMAWCPHGSSEANTIRELLAAPPVEQPAAAPIPPNAQLRRVMDLLDTHLGDSDLMLEGMTQEEIEEEFPVVAAMQIIVGLYQDPPTASDTAPSPADEQRIEAMARAMNVATDGHDRYWTGYVRSATAALRALRKLHPAPSPADERAALNFTELNDLMDTMQHAPHGKWARRKDAVVFADAAQRAALARAASASETGAEGARDHD